MGYLLKRWTMFFLIGLPIQLLVYILYPIYVTYWFLFVRPKACAYKGVSSAKWTFDDLAVRAQNDVIRDGYFLNNTDDTCALTHMYLWELKPGLALNGLMLLENNGTLYRRWPDDSGLPLSGDCLTSWIGAYNNASLATKQTLRPQLSRLAWSYLKNCFGLPCSQLNGNVSARCSNGGVNWAADGWKGLTNPCLNVNYFCSAALFITAARNVSVLWWVPYGLNWLLMGGWLYALLPYAGIPQDWMYYEVWVNLVNLYSIRVNSCNPLYRWSIWYMYKFCSPGNNLNPTVVCWAKKADAMKQKDVEEAQQMCLGFAPDWPQVSPIDPTYPNNYTQPNSWSIIAAGAKILNEK